MRTLLAIAALALAAGCASTPNTPYWDAQDDTGWGWRSTQVVVVDLFPRNAGRACAYTVRVPANGACVIYMRSSTIERDLVLGHEYLHCLGLNHRNHPVNYAFQGAC